MMKAGAIVIDPFQLEKLGTNSYDVTLGEWICFQKPDRLRLIKFGTEDAREYMWMKPQKVEHVTIRPNETVLAHTQEIIGGRFQVTTEMKARSTTGRHGLSVCKCAGLGDVGFISKWTMEITNHSNFSIEIPVGARIAQICFYNVGIVSSEYQGSYGQGEWSPQDMLPKASE